jgi:ABC-type branched-subunit amino acid transport system ATPase component
VLTVENLRSRYGRIEVLHGIDLSVGSGEIVTVVGANGAGKTTLLRCLSGVQPVSSGEITFRGDVITKVPAWRRPGLGLSQSPEGRQIFTNLSVEDNLRETEKYIRQKFPEKFGETPRQNTYQQPHAAQVEGGQRGGANGSARGVNDLPPEAKQAGNKFVTQGLYKDLKEYAADYWAQE